MRLTINTLPLLQGVRRIQIKAKRTPVKFSAMYSKAIISGTKSGKKWFRAMKSHPWYWINFWRVPNKVWSEFQSAIHQYAVNRAHNRAAFNDKTQPTLDALVKRTLRKFEYGKSNRAS